MDDADIPTCILVNGHNEGESQADYLMAKDYQQLGKKANEAGNMAVGAVQKAATCMNDFQKEARGKETRLYFKGAEECLCFIMLVSCDSAPID